MRWVVQVLNLADTSETLSVDTFGADLSEEHIRIASVVSPLDEVCCPPVQQVGSMVAVAAGVHTVDDFEVDRPKKNDHADKIQGAQRSELPSASVSKQKQQRSGSSLTQQKK